MLKKLLVLLLASVVAFPLATTMFAQGAPTTEKMAKQARWEGHVVRSNKDKSTREIQCSQIDDYRLKGGQPTHWVRWTVIGVVVIVGIIGINVLIIIGRGHF